MIKRICRNLGLIMASSLLIACNLETRGIPLGKCTDPSMFGEIKALYPMSAIGNLEQWPNRMIWFRWEYRFTDGRIIEDWNNECVPTQFEIHLTTSPWYTDDLVIPLENPQINFSLTEGNSHILYTTSEDLIVPEPGAIYRWTVVGRYQDVSLVGTYDSIEDLHSDQWYPVWENWFANRTVFMSGPQCYYGNENNPPLPRLPIEDQAISPLNPHFAWDSACTTDSFSLALCSQNDYESTQGTVIEDESGLFCREFAAEFPLFDLQGTLEDCQQYSWKVKIAGEYTGSSYSEPGTFRTDSGTCPTPTPMRLGNAPLLIPQMAVNCRAGTSPEFEILAGLEEGMPVPVKGVNHAQDWYLVEPSPALTCWVWNGNVEVQGDFINLPILPDPVLLVQTETPGSGPVTVNCSLYNNNFTGCIANISVCVWEGNVKEDPAKGGVCINR
jgi:hypothetical protein